MDREQTGATRSGTQAGAACSGRQAGGVRSTEPAASRSARTYIAIDLKSFYASAEAAARGFDPMTTNLVVADPSRTEKTICLAVSPSLKAHGISGRARLFEVVQRVKEINRVRLQNAIRLGAVERGEDGRYHFKNASYFAPDLEADPSLEMTYYIAPPRMKLYEEISTKIVSIYMRYISPDDIIVYSIDECFLDVTDYLDIYHMTAHELAITMIREVLTETGITATAGIGTNLYLAKIAMDIVAKHVPADKDGVRIAELDEMTYRELLWCHRPLTDFWRVGPGIAKRLEKLGCYTMGDIARLSEYDEGRLYTALGINAELLIDHAWGWEPTDVATIKMYKPQSTSLGAGQVLMEPYTVEKARLIVKEMTDLLTLDLVRKGLVTKKIELTIGYDRTSITGAFSKNTASRAQDRLTSGAAGAGDGQGRPALEEEAGAFGRDCPTSVDGTGALGRECPTSEEGTGAFGRGRPTATDGAGIRWQGWPTLRGAAISREQERSTLRGAAIGHEQERPTLWGAAAGRRQASVDGPFYYASTGKRFRGSVGPDHLGRPCPKHAHGTGNLEQWTSSTRKITACMMDLFDRIVDPDLTVRRVNIAAVNLIPENEIPPEMPEQLNLFTDYEALEKKRAADRAADEKERKMQEATLALQRRFGKNAVLKGMNLLDGATTILRNGQIGGHAAVQPEAKTQTRQPQGPAQSKQLAPAGASQPQEGEDAWQED